MKKQQYNLLTAITMIVGIVIGSGIFFKSDNILIATEGSIALGVLVFCLAAISIIFGSLTVAELAARTSKAGGIITYAEEFGHPSIACALGWFHTFLYYPTLIAVVSWVIGIYTCILFNIEGTLLVQVLIGFGMMCILFIMNILSARLGGYFQNASTLIKLIPLFLIALLGLLFGNPSTIHMTDLTHMKSTAWLAAIAPIAFSFDGWIIATSVGHEIKNAQRNLPLALIFAPLFILAIYILYFIGISTYLGPDTIMALGDEHVYIAATQLLGPWGAKLILIFVIVSVMGTVNGLIIGMIRLPYALSIRGMFPWAHRFTQIDEKSGIPKAAAFVAFGISTLWILIHYWTQKESLLPNSDVSEISITINYVLYIILYVQVFALGVKGDLKGIWRGKINPILATLGSLMILMGTLSNPLFKLHAILSCLLLLSAIAFWTIKHRK